MKMRVSGLILSWTLLIAPTAFAAEQTTSANLGGTGLDAATEARLAEAMNHPNPPGLGHLFPFTSRSIDGTGNNMQNPAWGSAHQPFLRLTTPSYENGVDSPRHVDVSAREVSNICVAQPEPIENSADASDYLWQWGQFIDHDLDEAPTASPTEPFDVEVPLGDPFFDPTSSGTAKIPLNRTASVLVDGVRQQVNNITAYLDGSMVYGSDPVRAAELRTLDGTGRLRTTEADLLPFNTAGLPNAPNTDPSFFLAGDVRVNEQIGLTAMHTLFVREHNFWAHAVHEVAPHFSDEEIYQAARAFVGAEIQAITYNEFLPLLLGKKAIPPYRGYDMSINAGISNAFATAAYRVGHTLLSPVLQRLDADGNEIPEGSLSLADSFFRPDHVMEAGIDPILRGLADQRAQEIDSFIVDPVRNFLFGPPGAGGFDLASLNIQRGREHGLPGYNQARVDFGLTAVTSFAEINPDPAVQARLSAAYATVDDIDLWVGGLSERHAKNALVGPTFKAILVDQFTRLRDGDRFFYRRSLPRSIQSLVDRQTLSVIIQRNTGIGSELQKDVFRTPRN